MKKSPCNSWYLEKHGNQEEKNGLYWVKEEGTVIFF